jgi:type IV pilus assembly protein PilO
MRLNLKSISLPPALGNAAAWKEPRVLVRIFLGVLLAANLVAAGYAFNLFGSSPEALSQSLVAAEARLQMDQARLARSRVLASSIGRGKTESDTFLATYFTSRRTTYSTIIGEINETAKTAGMKEQEGTIAPLDPIEGSDDLSMMTISINFEGSFAQFVKFVNMLDRSPRFLIIESLQATPQPKGDVLNTNLKLHVFVKEDPGGAL